jgi:hypothetical protein
MTRTTYGVEPPTPTRSNTPAPQSRSLQRSERPCKASAEIVISGRCRRADIVRSTAARETAAITIAAGERRDLLDEITEESIREIRDRLVGEFELGDFRPGK